MKLLQIAFLILCFSSVSIGQKTYFVKEGGSKASISFAKVYPDVGEPMLTDIDGRFTVSDAVLSVRIRYSNYSDSVFILDQLDGNELLMRGQIQEVQEVLILPGENPAHRIIKKVIANRKVNNPMKSEAFRYNSYAKFTTQADPKALGTFPDSIRDSTLLRVKNLSRKQHYFMVERSSTRTYFPPNFDREEVHAYKVSGFKDPLFTALAQQMQSFSFYNNTFDLFGKSYINPIAPGGTNRYLFIIEDTTIVGIDSVFSISFRPRKGKRFDGLKGVLFINTAGYAIEKVFAGPNEEIPTVSLKIIQEYAQIEPQKWFPNKLSSELLFPGMIDVGKAKVGLLLKSSTYIDSVRLNPDKTRWMRLNNENIVIDENAGEKSAEEWEKLRRFELSEREEKTYQVVDSISKAENFDKYLAVMKVLATGKIPLGYFNANLNKLLNYNGYEGLRLGLGLETSKKLIKPITLGGYFAYGFKDKAWKYGGKLDVRLYPKKSLKLTLEYKDDVLERGGRIYPDEGFSLLSTRGLRDLYINSMDGERVARATLSLFALSNFKVSLFSSYNRLFFQDKYQFASNPLENPVSTKDFGFAGVEFYWKIREKVQILGEQRLALTPTKFPILFVRLDQSIPGFYKSNSRFTRLYTEISQSIAIRGFGSFSYLISAGKTMGNSPLTFAQTPITSRSEDKFMLSVPNTFETIISSEYYLQDQVSLFTRLNFPPFRKIGEKSQPQLSLHHAIGFGNRVENGGHFLPTSYKGMQEGYFEGGMLLNNLYNSNFSGIGVGVFCNYGPNHEPDFLKNVVIKISISAALN